MNATRVREVLVLALVTAAVACGAAGPGADTYEAGPQARRHALTGVVRGASAESRQITVAHEDIPGLMDGMTMSFAVKDEWVARVATPGDRITATLVLDGARSWLEGVTLSKPDAAAAAGASQASATAAGIGPAAGTPLPAQRLRDQDGRTVTAASFSGRPVIYTFIYTRCPVPDYCPLMMTRLNEAAERLRQQGRRDEIHLVAITLDPAHDTPAVLRAYGKAHIKGEGASPFRRWSLLTGDEASVRAWATFFALTYSVENGQIVHGLRTAVVDGEQRVLGVLRGNDWDVDQLLALLPEA